MAPAVEDLTVQWVGELGAISAGERSGVLFYAR